MEIKAEGVARCNEMYTTSYPSIIYTRHCKYSKNIDVIEDIYYYYYHYSNRECDGAIGCSCSQIVCNATQYRLTRLYVWICGFVSRMVFFCKISPFVSLYFTTESWVCAQSVSQNSYLLQQNPCINFLSRI